MENNIVCENDFANYMAKDDDGFWWEYKEEPRKDISTWILGRQYFRKRILPNIYCSWENSLIKRERNGKVNIKKN